MRVMFTLVLGGALAAACPVSAQYSGGPGQSAARMDRFGQQLAERALDNQTGTSSDTQNPRRVARARRAAELINAGDCPGARALAEHAHDDRLVLRIDQVCATPSDAAATAAAGAPNAAARPSSPR